MDRFVPLTRARVGLRSLLRLTDRGGWVAPGVLGCAYSRTERALSALLGGGVGTLVNLHQRPHDPALLERHDLREMHLPVRDFAAPSPEQIGRSVGTILEALTAGEAAAVHYEGGLGRTGTVLACYLLAGDEGLGPEEAVRRVRTLRPGSVEIPARLAASERGPGAGPAKGFTSAGITLLVEPGSFATCLGCGLVALMP